MQLFVPRGGSSRFVDEDEQLTRSDCSSRSRIMAFLSFQFTGLPLALSRAGQREYQVSRRMQNQILSLLTVACMFPTPATAEIRAVTANPAEDCLTQMNIGWHADLGETSCTLVYTQRLD